ncbi:MAG: orotate phosphoribosyltransferase [Candidatus Omnitrophica bacterium]|nr:orotate phosphoribosyltransferase [Candidatus Omnitrophota bacterium]
MTEKEILDIFKKANAVLEGHFKLSSGKHSPRYLQCARVLERPGYAAKLCGELSKKFSGEEIDTVIAPALGGILVSYEVARSLGARALFTERVEGKMTLRRGFELGKNNNVLVVEDVITTGLSTREVIDVVKSFGSNVAGVGCLVNRSGEKIDFEARFEGLLKIEIPTFDPETCPLCKTGTPLVKPGSRGA